MQINHLSLYQIRFLSLQASVKCTAISDVQFAESNNSTPMTQIPEYDNSTLLSIEYIQESFGSFPYLS